jgi:hypothetical protein
MMVEEDKDESPHVNMDKTDEEAQDVTHEGQQVYSWEYSQVQPLVD